MRTRRKHIDTLASIFGEQVAQVLRTVPAARITVIGHSLGGVVAMLGIHRLASGERMHISQVVTIDSPLRGVGLGRRILSDFFSCDIDDVFSNQFDHYMAHNSRWIKELGQGPDPGVRTLSFYTPGDLVVTRDEAALPGSQPTDITDVVGVQGGLFCLAHCAGLFSAQVRAGIRSGLNVAPPAAASSLASLEAFQSWRMAMVAAVAFLTSEAWQASQSFGVLTVVPA